jgi:hypothetical protein
MERPKVLAFLLTVAFPVSYAVVILWAAKYRFRSTTRHLLIAMTVIALLIGFASVLATLLRP